MTDEEILLEYETELAFDDKPLSTCPSCGWKTHQDSCPVCKNKNDEPVSLSGDIVMDEIVAKDANGEEFDLEHAIRYGEFVPVTFDDIKERVNE